MPLYASASGTGFAASSDTPNLKLPAGVTIVYDENDVASLELDGSITLLADAGEWITIAPNGGSSDSTGATLVNITGSSGVLLPQLGAAPSSPTEGLTYYDTTLHKLRTWNGSSWNNLF